jgi:hypothetical protein
MTEEKACELGPRAQELRLDVLAVIESHEDAPVQEIPAIPGYQWFGRPRGGSDSRRRGGVGFYVAETLLPSAKQVLEGLAHPDSMWLHVSGGDRPLRLCAAYMPDVSKHRPQVTQAFAELAADVHAMQEGGAEVVLMGDFNARVGCAVQAGDRVGQFGEAATNTHGPALINLLRECDLYALNSRTPNDGTPGAIPYTRRRVFADKAPELSILDYIIVDAQRFAHMDAQPPTHALAQVDSDWQIAGTDHLLVWATLPGFGASRRLPAAHGAARRALPDVSKLRRPPTHVDGQREEAPEVQAYQAAVLTESGEYARVVDRLQQQVASGGMPALEAVRTAKQLLVDALMRAVSASIGFRRSPPANKPRHPWWGPELDAAVHAKRAAAAAWRQSPSLQTAIAHHAAMAGTKAQVRAAKQAAREAADAKLNAAFEDAMHKGHCPTADKAFWRTLNALHRRPPRHGARALEDASGRLTTDPSEIAAIFAAHNAAVGDPARFADGAGFDEQHYRAVTHGVRQQLANSTAQPPHPKLDAPIHSREVHAAVAQLHYGKAASPVDDISAELLKKGAGGVHDMLLALWGMQWELERRARTPGAIIEVHKGKGKPTTRANSYRPIQLLSTLDKGYDRLLNNRLAGFLEADGHLHEAQNGFRSGRDCLEHVLSLHTIVQRRREQGLDTYVFFNDQQQAYDTVWRDAILHKLHGKGVQGKFLRVVADLLADSTAFVSAGGVRSREFNISQGVEQGGTISPTLFSVFVDAMLGDVWDNCAGVPLDAVGDAERKFVASMFADDFAGVAATAADMQSLVDRVCGYYATWRMKANIPKCAIMVIPGKPRGGGQRAELTADIRWGGPGGEPIEQVQEYTYMGVKLHSSCDWEPQLDAAIDKMHAKANTLTKLLRGRTTSGGVKRMTSLVLLRPTLEWGAGVWRPNKGKRARIDGAQAALLKSAFHCPPTTCHSVLLQELAVRPMSIWFDKRMLELWHRVINMSDDRLVKQVVIGAGPLVGRGGRRGARQTTWLDRVKEALDEWGIEAQQAAALSKGQFKQLLHERLHQVVRERLEAEAGSSVVLREYMGRRGCGDVQFKQPKAYLDRGACNRGKELILQLRTGSLPLASLTGKFGRHQRSRRGEVEDDVHYCCPACSKAVESTGHFLLECEAYDGPRQDLFSRLAAAAPERWMPFAAVQSMEDKAWMLLDDASWKDGVVADLIAPYVYECWQLRKDAKLTTAYNRSDERGADGSDAMA